ncbi:MAG TPA: hypothetical protein VK550_30895 [Polyangiaceae bacterium]|nr:hypothetical protein [Polyangiaceae bacterium]
MTTALRWGGPTMTPHELVAVVSATARHLSPEQRVLVARFVGVLTMRGAAVQRADADRARREVERAWEEEQLSPGRDLDRRRREPA